MSNEADTCRIYVLPKLYAAGWDDEQIREQVNFTDGRINVKGGKTSRDEKKKADYLLRYRHNYFLAVVEAKADYLQPDEGLQQAKEYADALGLYFVYATNGKGIVEFNRKTGVERVVDEFPTPEQLWQLYREYEGLGEVLDDKLLVAYHESDKLPRYYQRIAINRTIEAVLKGDKRILLTLATGTGKTLIAFQVAWKLWQARWNVKGESRRSRVLFLADRSILVDDPKDKMFAPFDEARHKIEHGKVVTSREMYFATYQSIARDEWRPGLYLEYPADFFDLIIVDEAHRGSARDHSSWREILEYFSGAVQLGMTATPLREENRDTYNYFGEPLYTYSLKQGIQDGFLAPYQVRRVVVDVDATGYRPHEGQTDDHGRVIPDREYHSANFETTLVIKDRTKAVARHLTSYLKKTNRLDRTIVFCADQEHAQSMRSAIAEINADMLAQYPNYVVRVTADDREIGKKHLSKFQDVELDNQSPIIITTSKLLTTGVDAPMVKNVVLFRVVDSIVDFKQIIGRGTRVREDYGKLYFTIIDYTGSATRNFADPEFDGDPIAVINEKMGVDGEPEEVAEDGQAEIVAKPTGLASVNPHDQEEAPRKFYLSNGVAVNILNEVVWELGPDGKRQQMVQLTTYTGEQVRSLYADVEALRQQWAAPTQREQIIKALAERGIDLEHVAAVAEHSDADPFDLLCYLAYNAPLHTRSERAARLRKEKAAFFAKYSPQAQAVLDAILDKYTEYGPDQIVPGVVNVQPINKFGNALEISNLFGGPQNLREAITELQTLLYAA